MRMKTYETNFLTPARFIFVLRIFSTSNESPALHSTSSVWVLLVCFFDLALVEVFFEAEVFFAVDVAIFFVAVFFFVGFGVDFTGVAFLTDFVKDFFFL